MKIPEMPETPLRILSLANVPENPNAGAAGTEVQTNAALRALGHQVDALWADSIRRRLRHGNLHQLLELPYRYEQLVRERLEAAEYEVVHVNQPHGYRAARLVRDRWPQTPFVHRSHGFELNVEETLRPWRETFDRDERGTARRMASSAMARLLDRHARAIAVDAGGHIVSSSLDATFLRDRMGVAPERIATIRQGAPDDYLRRDAGPMDRERLRCVLYVGQFAFVKAPMITAGAINRLIARDPDLRVTWVCAGSDHPHVASLLDVAAAQRTELLPWMPQDELRDVYDRHGIFLFPSFFEGFGKAFLEAMSRGLCVIASDVGGMHDLIDHGRNGLLVAPGDAQALAEAALTVIADPERAAAMSAAAALTARAHTWERVARETVAFYRRLRGMRR
jgi:glycosyltransferase involved in cell wall biosynthesis